MIVNVNVGFQRGKMEVEKFELRRGEVALIELMFISIGEDFHHSKLKNPNWRFLHSWSFEQKAVWAAQAYDLLKSNAKFRRDAMRIAVATQPELYSFLYAFGNKWCFRQSRDLRHVTAQKLVRVGRSMLLSARAEPRTDNFLKRLLRFFGGES